jgi:hypothetical protein
MPALSSFTAADSVWLKVEIGPIVSIFEFGAPVRREAIFDADAQQHARQCGGAFFEFTGGVVLGEAETALRHTGLAVEQPAVEGEAGAHRYVGGPNDCGRKTRP